MVWGDESQGRSDQFEAVLLPKSQVRDPKDSAILGIGAAAPTEDARGEGAGLVNTGASTGSENSATQLPSLAVVVSVNTAIWPSGAARDTLTVNGIALVA